MPGRGDLTSAFNFKTPNADVLPQLSGQQTRLQADELRENQEVLGGVPVPTDTKLPIQKSGIRLSRTLCWELHTSARCNTDGKVQLIFSNTGKQTAVFHVYGYNLILTPYFKALYCRAE
ncbi:hypothetical protein ACLFLN_05625 [Acinetobacter pittii]